MEWWEISDMLKMGQKPKYKITIEIVLMIEILLIVSPNVILKNLFASIF